MSLLPGGAALLRPSATLDLGPPCLSDRLYLTDRQVGLDSQRDHIEGKDIKDLPEVVEMVENQMSVISKLVGRP